ncbi:MAG: carbohydrate-binding module family 20 domain-containing protein, partial [Bacteroidota bacterium]
FQGWDPSTTPLADQGNGIWSVTVAVAENSSAEYKFINGNAWGQDETIPSGCQSNGNRLLAAGAMNETLPEVCFGSCTVCAPPTVDVTLEVDMSNETVDANGVHVAGDFQNWDPGATPLADQGNGIWSVTIQLAQNTTYQYKYINGNVWGQDEGVPAECAVNSNRELTTGMMNETIPVHCFADCAACPPLEGCTDIDANNYDPAALVDNGSCLYTVTFQVDMSQFPGVFTAPEVTGTMNGFTYGSIVLSDDDFDNVFSGTAELTNGQYEFLFAVDAGASQESFNGSESCTVNTEGFWNRVLVVNGETTYPVNCYDSCDSCVPTSSDVRITAVDVVNGEVTLTNFGTASQEVGTYWFCNFPQYSQFSSETIVSGLSLLDPGASVTYAWSGATGAAGECGIYSVNGSYNDPNAIIDYMQWESANNQRSGVAVSAGVWDDAANFVSGNSPYIFNGGSGDYGSTFWSGTLPVNTYDITFQVDMSLETVGPDGVRIAGNFNDPDGDGNIDNAAYPQWDPAGIQLLDGDNDNIYDVTLTLADGFTYEYKYINGNAWGQDEGVPAECQANGNRFYDVNGADEVLAAHCFASCDPCVFNDFTVTFQVDMSEQVVDGAGVHLAGSFNGWDPLANPMTDMGNGLWSIDLMLTAGDVHTYQFVNGNDINNAETVPTECGVDDGNNGFYREITVPGGDTTLDLVCFSGCEGCVSSVVDVTFQVDMSEVGANGIGVFIVGSFQLPNPWADGADQMADQGNDIYTYTASLPAGSVIEYKYLNGPNFFNEETVPSACGVDNGLGGFNRTHTVGFADETIDLHCFSSCVGCDIPPINVTFQVDMSDETVDPLGVHIEGAFQGWDPGATPMVDQGNGIWTYTAMIEPNTSVQYKFINGNVWGQDEMVPGECNVSGNREVVLGGADVTL